MDKNEKTSLERSHSKSSNAKLTSLCIFTSIIFTLIWVVLALGNTLLAELLSQTIVYIIAGGLAVIFVFCLMLFNKFTR